LRCGVERGCADAGGGRGVERRIVGVWSVFPFRSVCADGAADVVFERGSGFADGAPRRCTSGRDVVRCSDGDALHTIYSRHARDHSRLH